MLALSARRLATTVPVMVIVATFTFFLVQLVPGDPAAFLLGAGATRQQVAELRAQLGLDESVLEQYVSWLGDVLRGDLGVSLLSGQPVTDALAQALPVTLSVALLALLFTLVVGIALGTLAAVYGGRVDRAVQVVCSIGMAVPNFWLAAVLVLALAIALPLLPATEYVPLSESPMQWLEHMVLPTVAVGLAGVGPVAFQARAAVLETLGRDYVRTLVAAGIPRRRILFKHVLRNAGVPVVTVASLGFVFMLGGVVVIEAIFNLPGLGTLMLNSVRSHDLPVVQGAVLLFSLLVVGVNLLADLAAATLDPRVRRT